MKDGTLSLSSPEVREILMGFTSGDTEAEGLSSGQCVNLLGKCTDLNILHWTLSLTNTPPSGHRISSPRAHPGTPWESTYTFSYPFPDRGEAHTLPIRGPHSHNAPTKVETLPTPMPWTPRFSPEEWVYTDGSDIKRHPRLGAAVVYIPSCTIIYIDAAGCDETRTIMRAELVAIHTALTIFEDHSWLVIFTDSLSSLHTVRLHYFRPGL